MKQFKTTEIDYNRNVYSIEYEYSDNRLVIESITTQNEDEETVELDSINDKEVYQRLYELTEKETASDKLDEAEYYAELRYSIAEEKADERRKYGK